MKHTLKNITAVAVLILAFIAISVMVIAQHNAVLGELDKRDALQAQRIEQLEKKMDKNNQLIERTYALDKATAVIQNDMKADNHRIDDLEKKG